MKINAEVMALNAKVAANLLRELANPHRLMILCQLIDGERSVSDLARLLGLRVSTMSQHLGLLRRDCLVVARRAGQTIFYRLGDPAAQRIVETLFAIYCAPQSDAETRLCAPQPHTTERIER